MDSGKEATGGTGGEGTEVERDMETEKDLTNWEKVVALVGAFFGEGRLVEESTWQAVVLVPKKK